MTTGWTAERRERQAQLIRTWRPWEKSTGPRTHQGKATSSRNADKPDSFNRRLRQLKSDLKLLAQASKEVIGLTRR